MCLGLGKVTDENIFEAENPLGQIVICSRSVWENHILIGHPFMEGCAEIVKNAVETPDNIFESEEYPNERDIYFKYNTHNNLYTKVVTQKHGLVYRVVSAWFQKSVKGNIGGLKYVKSKL